MSDNSNRYPTREKTLLDYAGLRLSAAKLKDGEQRPSLAFYTAKNGVRIDVYTNVPGDKKNGNIRADLNPTEFFVFLAGFKSVLDKKEEAKFNINIKEFVWSQGQKSKEPLLDTRLMVARDKDGLVYLSLLSYDNDRPKIKFIFETPWKKEILINGKEATAAELSEIVAKGFHDALASLAPVVMANVYKEPEKKEEKGSGGNNGGGYGKQNSNYNNRKGSDRNSDDDSSSSSSVDTDTGNDWSDDDDFL